MSGSAPRRPHRRTPATILLPAVLLAVVAAPWASAGSALPGRSAAGASSTAGSPDDGDRTGTTNSGSGSGSGTDSGSGSDEGPNDAGGAERDGSSPRAEPDLLAVSSVSPWVAPDGDFQVRFDPSARVPADAQLTTIIHQSLDPGDDLRDEVRGILDGGSAGGFLRGPMTRPVTELGDPAAGLVVTIPIRSGRGDSERVLVPNAGIHPVELVLTAGDGPELWRRVVFLNRLPVLDDGEPRAAPVRVSLLVPLGSGPAVTATSTGAFGLEERTSLEAIGALLDDARGAPLTIAARPNTLDGLTLTDEPWARSLLSSIRDPGSGHELLALPYVAVDAGGLVGSGSAEELTRQIDLGRDTVARVAGRAPLRDTWTFDATVTRESLSTLARSGITSMLLADTALELPSDLGGDDVSTRPVRLSGDSGIRALAFDGEVSGLLAGAVDEPGVRAHEIVTMLMARWFDRPPTRGATGPASVVLVTAGTDARVLDALRPSLTGDGPLLADAGANPLPPAQDPEEEPVATLVARQPTDQRPAYRAAATTRRLTDAYRSMTGAADPDLWAWERVNDQTMASTIDDGQRLQMHAAVRTALDAKVDLVEPPRERRVVLTSRETTIPLRFRNDLPFDVHLMLRARSTRLDIGGGDLRRITLAPGENRVDLPVSVQAPGESLLRIDLTSPVAGIDLGGPDVPVRSTAISGVGAALSIVSVLFLVGWWVHTHRRERRKGAKLAGAHPSGRGEADSLPRGG